MPAPKRSPQAASGGPVDADPSSPTVLEGPALPAAVRDLPEPPARLFSWGRLPAPPMVAIVGTRRPTAQALRFARDLAEALARAGVAIASGGAIGIDRAAHEGALTAGGYTLVVAPCGLSMPYPAEHASFFAEVLRRGGGYLCARAGGQGARRHDFFLRNALLAALSHAVILVECPYRSGARNAMGWARRLGRAGFVVPAAPWNTRGNGCIEELRLGGRPLGGADEVLELLREQRAHSVPRGSAQPASRAGWPAEPRAGSAGPELPERAGGPPPGRGASRAQPRLGAGGEPLGPEPAARGRAADPKSRVAAAVRCEALSAGQVALRCGLSAAEASYALTLLQLEGAVQRDAAGLFTSTRR